MGMAGQQGGPRSRPTPQCILSGEEVLFLSLATREWDQGMVIHDLFNIHSSP